MEDQDLPSRGSFCDLRLKHLTSFEAGHQLIPVVDFDDKAEFTLSASVCEWDDLSLSSLSKMPAMLVTCKVVAQIRCSSDACEVANL